MLQTLNNLAGKISPTSGGAGGVGGAAPAPPTVVLPDCPSAKLVQINNNNRINNNNTIATNNNNNCTSINNNSPFAKQIDKLVQLIIFSPIHSLYILNSNVYGKSVE